MTGRRLALSIAAPEEEPLNYFPQPSSGCLTFGVHLSMSERCAVIPLMKMEGWGRIINISGANARNAGHRTPLVEGKFEA